MSNFELLTDNTKRPNVALSTVGKVSNAFRCHPTNRSEIVLRLSLLTFFFQQTRHTKVRTRETVPATLVLKYAFEFCCDLKLGIAPSSCSPATNKTSFVGS
jgi:hypothetical protein